jgi:TolA-binding protein
VSEQSSTAAMSRVRSPRRWVGMGTVALAALLVSGCATKSDIRDLQEIVAETSRQQTQVLAGFEQSLAMTADSLQRGQSQGRVELQGSVLTRLNEISGRLDRLEALMGYVSDEVSTMRDEVRSAASRPAPVMNRRPEPEVTPPGSGFPGEQSADQLLAQALEDYRSGSIATAKMEYEAFIEDHPDDPRVAEARFRRAVILKETDDPEVALTAFQEIRQLYPDDVNVPSSMYHIAQLYIELGEAGEARDVLKRLIATYPDHPMESIAAGLLREIGGSETIGSGPVPTAF